MPPQMMRCGADGELWLALALGRMLCGRVWVFFFMSFRGWSSSSSPPCFCFVFCFYDMGVYNGAEEVLLGGLCVLSFLLLVSLVLFLCRIIPSRRRVLARARPGALCSFSIYLWADGGVLLHPRTRLATRARKSLSITVPGDIPRGRSLCATPRDGWWGGSAVENRTDLHGEGAAKSAHGVSFCLSCRRCLVTVPWS